MKSKSILLVLCLYLSACDNDSKSSGPTDNLIDSGSGELDACDPPESCEDLEEIKSLSQEMMELVNQSRANLGLAALSNSIALAYGASEWSQTQYTNQVISHDGFPGQRLSTIQSRFPDFASFLRAENVAMGYLDSMDNEDIVAFFFDLWWNSPGHKANMLGDFTGIGFGVSYDEQGTIYGTQIFY